MKNPNCIEVFTNGKIFPPHVVHPSLIIWVNDYKWVLVQVKTSIMSIVWLDMHKLKTFTVFRAAAAVPLATYSRMNQ